jgi:hypothetical protein
VLRHTSSGVPIQSYAFSPRLKARAHCPEMTGDHRTYWNGKRCCTVVVTSSEHTLQVYERSKLYRQNKSQNSSQRTMNRCPVCQEEQHADTRAFNHHVNAHFTEGGAGPSRSGGSRPAQKQVARWVLFSLFVRPGNLLTDAGPLYRSTMEMTHFVLCATSLYPLQRPSRGIITSTAVSVCTLVTVSQCTISDI